MIENSTDVPKYISVYMGPHASAFEGDNWTADFLGLSVNNSEGVFNDLKGAGRIAKTGHANQKAR